MVAGEYPGYGVYKGAPSETKINADASTIYEFVLNKLNVREQDVLLCGRSIGTGPATFLASRKSAAALILMSPFTSIRAVAKHRVGVVGQYLVKEQFKNIEHMALVNSPTLVIHGRKDQLVPHKHAKKLFGKTMPYQLW